MKLLCVWVLFCSFRDNMKKKKKTGSHGYFYFYPSFRIKSIFVPSQHNKNIFINLRFFARKQIYLEEYSSEILCVWVFL